MNDKGSIVTSIQLNYIKEIIEERIFDPDCNRMIEKKYGRGCFLAPNFWIEYMKQILDRKQPILGNIVSDVHQGYIDLYCDLFGDDK